LDYYLAKAEQETEGKAYRYYVAEGIKMLTHDVAAVAGGMELSKSLIDIETELKYGNIQKETRSADEVKDYMKQKLERLGGKEG
jgi:hypothetical protein